ncbi:MAG: bifunctional folylpolyglutamate synthase/dihydrofolate synthase, partial [Paludibacteraceae bacterium]|nr:bifunctional folylpolyglutamate synthase/dihydrofolate synthase [Paludibacteraceae bacterium]
MNYSETLQYLFVKTPMFSQVGAAAYKEGLDTTLALSAEYGDPHKAYKTVHVAGTNGKGSTTHTIASVLQEAGYKTGLYTSPHLKDFSERIRVNGKPIDEQYVVDFVENAKPLIDKLQPSFFESTTIMAFKYFLDLGVDVAVIDTGVGGRLDSTNLISPLVSIITYVSFDHVA